MDTKDFFEFAMKRHLVYLKKQAGLPAPWTDDPIIANYRFTNVYRELDKTTVWIRENVRDHVGAFNAVYAVTLARWFNRIETLELILPELLAEHPDRDWEGIREVIREKLQGVQPLVTGAYMIKTPTGLNKLDGILWCMDRMMEQYLDLMTVIQPPHDSLEETWNVLLRLPFLGEFMAYEIVTDLRWIPGLLAAKDKMTWANPGPGCTHGLGVLLHNDPHMFNRHSQPDRRKMMTLMQGLLEQSRQEEYWPQEWPAWEMREVEHTLCEFYKYVRASQIGRMPKVKYLPSASV